LQLNLGLLFFTVGDQNPVPRQKQNIFTGTKTVVTYDRFSVCYVFWKDDTHWEFHSRFSYLDIQYLCM